MTSLKQIEANRLNALKSTGPRTEAGKQRSRQNALCHGLTATVITALETAGDYAAFQTSILVEYQPRTATERELVSRLTSLLWRLRRATSIETGLFQIQAELMQNRTAGTRRRNVRLPEWYGELDVSPALGGTSREPDRGDVMSADRPAEAQSLAYCFMQVSRIQFGSFDLLCR